MVAITVMGPSAKRGKIEYNAVFSETSKFNNIIMNKFQGFCLHLFFYLDLLVHSFFKPWMIYTYRHTCVYVCVYTYIHTFYYGDNYEDFP